MEDEYYKRYEPFWDSWYIKRFIGAGSYGKVFEIEEHDNFGNVYKGALKAITVPSSQDEIDELLAGMSKENVSTYFDDYVERLNREIVLMSKLTGNSNIVSYQAHKAIRHDNGVGWDILIRMELLTPLNAYIDANGPLNEQMVIKLGIDICKALEICKQYNVIHRDIKPANIFISETNSFKLGDFGIARIASESTGASTKAGTPNYMAPEVYWGKKYTDNVDTYSLGIVMYQLLNSNRLPLMPPYPKDISFKERKQALTQRLSGASLPPPLNASALLANIVLKACAPSPADRYESPTQMRQELKAIYNPDGHTFSLWPTLHYHVSEGGTLRTSSKSKLKKLDLKIGEETNVTAVPDDDYEFSGWNDGLKEATRKDKALQKHDVVITANFSKKTSLGGPGDTIPCWPTLHYRVSGGGTLRTSSNSKLKELDLKIEEETNVTAVPDDGYEFSGWSDGLKEITRKDKASQEHHIVIMAEFSKKTSPPAPKTTCVASYIVSGPGVLSSGDGTSHTTLTLTVEEGASVSVTATPKVGYHFVRWSDGLTTANRVDKITKDNLNVAAIFEKEKKKKEKKKEKKKIVHYVIIVLIVWQLLGFVGFILSIFDSTNSSSSSESGSAISISSETTASSGEPGSTSVVERTGALIYCVEGGGTLSTSSASGLEELRLEDGEETNVTAVPDEGYEFSGWNDGVTDNPRKDEISEEDTVITAIFKKSDGSVVSDPTPDPTCYTATYSVSGSGTLKSGKTSGKTKLSLTVEEGKSVSVTAVPGANYHFVRWSDGSTNATRTDKNITSDLNITAVFEANPAPEPVPTPTPGPTKYTVQYTASGEGKIQDAKGNTHSTLSYTVTSSDAVSVAAVAASGYHFVRWSDGNTSATRTDRGFGGNVALTATFEKDAPPVSSVNWDYGNYGGGVVIYGYTSSSSISQLTIPSTLGGLPVVRIEKYAFSGRSEIHSVSIPSSVVEIGYNAFEGTGVSSVTVSASCSVDSTAFPSGCTVNRR